MNNTFLAAALVLAAPCALAQAGAEPARADAPVPPTVYASPLAEFRNAQPSAQPPSAAWIAANAAVAGQGHMGHMGHAGHEGHEGHAMPARPAAPAKRDDHSMHHGHGEEKKHDH